jgi:hypothetical protein
MDLHSPTYNEAVQIDLVSQGLSHCMTHPTTRPLDIRKSRPFPVGANASPAWGSPLFLLEGSILLKQDACSPVVQISRHNCLPQVPVKMTQDVTVKKKAMWRCSAVHKLSTPAVSLCHVLLRRYGNLYQCICKTRLTQLQQIQCCIVL